MPRARRDTQPMGMFGFAPPPAPSRKWAPMPGNKYGAEHLLELRGAPGDRRWEPLCGGWSGDGYRKVDRATTRCVACELIEKGKR